MSDSINPVYWSTQMIVSQGEDVICELAKKSAATVTAYRLVLGRCLLAIDETKIYRKLGLSCAVHYGIRVLGLSRKSAQTIRRVARALEGLPLLSRAAELGQIEWSSLREIVSKATAETEAFWLQLAKVKDCDQVQALVRCTEPGKLPWDQPEPALPTTRLQLNLKPELGEMLERTLQSLSSKLGKTMSATDTLEHLLIEHLAKRPLDGKVVEAARKDSRRGAAAAGCRQAQLIQEARSIAEELASVDEPDCPLSAALGSDPLTMAEAMACSGWDGNERSGMDGNECSGMAGNERSWMDGNECSGMAGNERSGMDGNECSGMAGNETWMDGNECSGMAGNERSWMDGNAMPLTVGGQQSEAVADEKPDERLASDGPRWDRREPYDDLPNSSNAGLNGNSSVGFPEDQSWATSDSKGLPFGRPSAMVGLFTCPGNPDILLAGNPNDWRNPRLKYNPRARKLTPAQRLDLLRRDGHRCRTPGCPHHLWLQFHHIDPYARNGVTSPEKVVGLCWRCHWNVHHGFMTIEGNAETGLIFRDAQGRDIGRHHALEVASWLDLHIGWSEHQWQSHKRKLFDRGIVEEHVEFAA